MAAIMEIMSPSVGAYCSIKTDVTITGSLMVAGDIRCQQLEDRLKEMSEQIKTLTALLEQCYIAPGMPGAPSDFSSM